MASREEKRMASRLAEWLGGEPAAPDAESRAVAQTAVLLVDALAPRKLAEDTRSRLYRRALAEYAARGSDPAPLGDLARAARQIPAPAWLGIGGVAAGVAVGLALLRQREHGTGI